ncbi:hypothetical protein LTR66_004868 [Elasticomyces elasticus]|nr:hypothetical protein LTR50_001976 [Elasticomyces elasticus]KAK4995283.1 hypothetical protein LTR66_004868 [Elasticomyces elasticus]
MRFCASSKDGEALEQAFATLSVSGVTLDTPPTAKAVNAASQPSRIQSDVPKAQELSTILMAMRKLREAIVGSHRTDQFAQRAYIFIIHATTLTKHMESYHPALLYLLRIIHPCTPLSAPELQEFVGYLILDLACRQGELSEADRRVDAVLNALVHDSWYRFWRIKRAVDGYQRALMNWADEDMRMHALKCLGRSYLAADKSYVERVADAKWEDLVKNGCGWQLEDGGKIMIRKPKPRVPSSQPQG